MDLIILPKSTSALDRWSDRAIRIVYLECALAIAMVIATWSYFPKPSQFEYDHPPMTKTKLAVAIPTIFLPLASCVTSWLSSRLRARTRNPHGDQTASARAPTKPLIYSSFQILQLIACSWLTAYDFVVLSARRGWFWFSLVYCFVPALAGTIYGFVGIVRFNFAGSTQLAFHPYRSPNAGEEYSDDAVEYCALERAYQQQLPDNTTDPGLGVAPSADGHWATDADILPLQILREETARIIPGDIQRSENHPAAQESGASRTTARDDQTSPRHSISPPTRPRFRWQEQTGARNGGRTFWGPMLATSGLLSIWGGYYKWLVRNSYYSPQLIRLLALEAWAPLTISAFGLASLTICLRRPRLALILTAFCFSVLASAIWFAESVYSVWCFFYYARQISVGFNLASFAMVLVSFGMTSCHVALLLCSIQMEWTPGYSSLVEEYKLWKERRGKVGAVAEEIDDEEM